MALRSFTRGQKDVKAIDGARRFDYSGKGRKFQVKLVSEIKREI